MINLSDKKRYSIIALPIILSLFTSCNPSGSVYLSIPKFDVSELLPGGAASVSFKPFASFELPAANIPVKQRTDFHAGKALARQPWIKAPATTDARDGLGPLYNARTCLNCHVNGGRGTVPADGKTPLFGPVVRLSLPGHDPIAGAVPEPNYGHQLQTQSVALSHIFSRVQEPGDPAKDPEAPPEAYAYLDWQTHTFTYPDGQTAELRKPQPRLERLGYGKLHPDTLFSLRAAPAIHGLGLLELIADQSIAKFADPDDRNGDGISGRINQVWDTEAQQTVPGRFGWKANQPNLRNTVAGAFHADVGISNPLFSSQPCSATQIRCLRTHTGNNKDGFELPDHLLKLVTHFTRNIGVPTREGRSYSNSQQKRDGRVLFYESGCASCHTPSHKTKKIAGANSHLGNQRIWPYSDLLLHDMGPELADGRPDFTASGSEWRTPPLWGIGLSKQVNGQAFLLHDGRARSIEEAILWHGGEGQAAQQQFVALNKNQRGELIRFVESL